MEIGRMSPWARATRAGAVCLAFVALAGLVSAQDSDKVTLRVRAEQGQVARYKGETEIKLSFAGQTMNIRESGTSETTVKGASDDGVTYERKALTTSTEFNGERMPDEGAPETVTTLKLAPNGTLLSYESKPDDDEDPNSALGVRLFLSTNVMFPDNPVGVGDTWSFDLDANSSLKTQAAKASFRLVGFEEVGGTRTAKIEMTYAETSGSPALSVTSTQWIEVDTGDSIRSEFSATGVSLDLGGESVSAEAKGTSERTSGGMIKKEGQTEPGDEEPTDAIEEKVKDFEKIEGLFTLYRRVNDGRTTLYLEIGPDQFEKLVMLQTTASTGLADGRIAAGDPINDLVFRFERTPNNRVVLKVPNFGFRAEGNEAIAQSVRRSFPDAIVDSYSIEAEHEGRVLINISNFFTGDISMVGQMLSGGGMSLLGGGGDSMSLDRENTYVKTLKNFPTNLYVEAAYNFVGRGGGGGLEALLGGSGGTKADPRSVVIQLNYNLFLLPTDNGYQPRLFDPRVGYFTVSYQDFTDGAALDQNVQYILRWNLQKKDPSAAVSDVVEPIVFHLDPAIPAEYRQAVKEAVEAWNPAFEKAGFRNAVVAKVVGEGEEIDHADMRYNFVRWINSPDSGYAIALFRVNPITGQILNASVSVDANIIRALGSEYDDFVRPEAVIADAKRLMEAHAGHQCNLMQAARANLAFGEVALRALGSQARISKAEYLRQFTKWVVMHEVGHTLGLRHNFAASTELKLADLADPAKVKQYGTAASVMDYVAFNPHAVNRSDVLFYGDRPGTYDEWAIAYGYQVIPGANSTKDERAALQRHASQTNSPGLTWLGDEFADSFDPYVTRFDLAGDPLAYWLKMGQMSKDILFKLDEFSPKPGQSFSWFRRDFNSLFATYRQSTSQLSRFIGGVRRNPNFKGDAGEQLPMAPISVEDQRAALDQIVAMAFDSKALAFPKRYYQMFQPSQNAGLLEGMIEAMNDYPMFDTLAGYQRSALSSVMSASSLRTLLNQEFKAEDPTRTLTAREVFGKVTAAVWSETDSATPVDMLRRQLQREHLTRLIDMVLDKDSSPAEAKTLAFHHLRVLHGKLKTGTPKVAHESTRMHWEESIMRIERALEARPSVGGTAPSSGTSLLEMLLGGASR